MSFLPPSHQCVCLHRVLTLSVHRSLPSLLPIVSFSFNVNSVHHPSFLVVILHRLPAAIIVVVIVVPCVVLGCWQRSLRGSVPLSFLSLSTPHTHTLAHTLVLTLRVVIRVFERVSPSSIVSFAPLIACGVCVEFTFRRVPRRNTIDIRVDPLQLSRRYIAPVSCN